MENYTRIDIFVASPDSLYNMQRIFNEIKPIYIKTQNFNFHKKLCNIISNVIFRISSYLSAINKILYYDKLFGTLNDCIFIDLFDKNKNSKTQVIKTIDEVEKYMINYFVDDFSDKYKYFYYVIPSRYEKIDNRLFISLSKMEDDEQILAKEYNDNEEDKIIYYMMKKMINDCLNPLYIYPTDEELKEFFTTI